MCSDLKDERSCQKKELPCYLWTERNCPSLKETCIASLFRILHFLTFDTVHSFLWTSKWKLKMESHFHKKRKEVFCLANMWGQIIFMGVQPLRMPNAHVT